MICQTPGALVREREDSTVIEPKSAAVINPRSHRLRAGICLLAGVICASFTLVHAADAQTKISIGYSPFIDALTAFAARTRESLPSTVSTRSSLVPLNSNMPAAILSGSVNLGAMSTTVFLQAIDAGLKLRIAQNISMLPNKDAVIAFATRSDVAFEGKGLEASACRCRNRFVRGGAVSDLGLPQRR
jgi:ABC-type nitrate/sulfonate/bicarbonate transport system substrate-binding protein